MNKGVKLIIAALFFLMIKMSWAITFGPIRVHSYIGQPLQASIVLTDVKNLQEVQRLVVRLADTSIYNQLGVVKAPEQNNYRFMARRDQGNYYIVVSTDKPINDTFVDFILTINGAEHKEFSAFVNPNPFQSASNGSVVVTNNASPTSRYTHKQVSINHKQSYVNKTKSGGFEGNRYGPIKKGEYLYKIAEKTIPEGVSKAQWVNILFHANPNAFKNNNIDSLIVGSYLNIPRHKTSTSVNSEKELSKLNKGKTKTTNTVNKVNTANRTATANRTPPANTANRTPTANTANRMPTANTANRTPTANTANRTPTANTANRTPTANTANRTPTANTANRTATANTANRTATANTANRTPTANTTNGTPIANTANRTPTANTANRTATANTANRTATANTANRTPTANTANRTPTANTQAIKPRPTSNHSLNLSEKMNYLPWIIVILIVALLILIFMLNKRKNPSTNYDDQDLKSATMNQKNSDSSSDNEFDKSKLEDSKKEQILNNKSEETVVELSKNETASDLEKNADEISDITADLASNADEINQRTADSVKDTDESEKILFNNVSNPYSNNLTTETIKNNVSNNTAMQINLDLAQVYIENNFKINKAKIWLNEVLEKGNDAQKNIASHLLKKIQ